MQWTRAGIPNFSSIIHPLSELREHVYAKSGNRTLIAAAKVLLN